MPAGSAGFAFFHVNRDAITGGKIRTDQGDPFPEIRSCTMVKQVPFLGELFNKLIQ